MQTVLFVIGISIIVGLCANAAEETDRPFLMFCLGIGIWIVAFAVIGVVMAIIAA